ncbi:MAG: putative porin [Pseudomonadales bacterium]
MRNRPTFSKSTNLAALMLLAWALVPGAYAATDQETIAALRAELTTLTQRLDALENKSTVPVTSYAAPEQTQAAPALPSWVERLALKGDFRFRHESFDVENREDRHRQRIRARTELTAAINDTVTVGFGLATGSGDPISTNQTLGDGASSKSIALDLAYASWNAPVEGLVVTGGKFKNPFFRAGGNGLIWDGDLRPEGASVVFKSGLLFASGLGLLLDEDSGGQDAFLLGGQFGVNTTLGNGELIAGVGYYHFNDTEDRDVFFDGDPRGNRTNPDGTYLSGFELFEGFAEYSFPLNDSELTLFADYVQNLGADDYDTGYALGAKLKQNNWSMGWAYQDLEADAVLGTLTDSDFIGGGTDGKGHILQAGYSLSKRIGLRGTLFLNDRNVDFGDEEDFKRLMLDISFKY